MKDTTIKLLQRKDQDFQADHFDFDFLRREGLKHIGELSGKIWTDHNVHDPGVTILEVLSYALMDLGYRTRLPIQDILAAPQDSPSDTYFTPAQILSNNPTTIMDYRKLLVSIEGVRNAWLMPNTTEKFEVLYREGSIKEGQKYRISCATESEYTESETNIDPASKVEFALNGLYTVCIQKEAHITDEEALLEKVLEKLHQHRNLCEDFASVKVLKEEKISFCADIELLAGHKPEEIYVKIILAIEQFLSPSIGFYTLQEMLTDKGKLIEDVFEGRPFDPTYNSPGFVDVEELENIPLRKEIHLSDIYGIINQIEGVAAVQNIVINGSTDNDPNYTPNNTDCQEWIFQLTKDHVPVFLVEDSCFQLSNNGANFQLNPFEVQRIRSQSAQGRNTGRASGNKAYLDVEPPQGNYRPDLGTYYSIQNEFPSVYGIGEGGLAPSASKQRQAQALQLKGYLLFFDQLLVNYLSQLSNARSLFSFDSTIPETDHNDTLDSVPNLDKILQFYNNDKQQAVAFIPIKKDDFFNAVQLDLENHNPLEFHFNGEKYAATNKLSRDIQIEQLAREIKQENYAIAVYPSQNCYYFVIQPDTLSVVLLARATFDTEEEARIVANNISYIARKRENYAPIDLPFDQKYSFDLLFTPSINTSLVEELTQTDQSRLDRKNLFLDHLLARFSESFTDYSLLVFDELKNNIEASKTLINVKSNFLSNYPNLSANRGRAFNYLKKEAVWGKDNKSGLEKRLIALTGLEANDKNYLCNFEIHQYGVEYQLVFSYGGKTIFKTKNVYDSFDKAVEVCQTVLEEARANDFYDKKDLKDCYLIVFNSSKYLQPLSFDTLEERDLCFYAIRNLFHQKAATDDVNVYPTHAVYYQELYNQAGEIIAQSTASYETEAEALTKQKKFINSIKDQKSTGKADLSKLKFYTNTTNAKQLLLERTAVNETVKVADSEYRWHIAGIDGKTVITSTRYVKNQQEAFDDYLKTVFDTDKRWEIHSDYFRLLGNNGKVIAQQKVSSDTAATLAIEEAEGLLSTDLVVQKHLKQTGQSYGFELRNPAGLLLVESVALYQNKKLVENLVEILSWNRYEMKEMDHKRSIIEFTDEKGVVIARTKNATNDPEGHLKEVQSYAERLEIVDIQDSWTFKVLDPTGSAELIEGFVRYTTPIKAFAALFAFLEDYQAGQLAFRPVGETEKELANIELFIIDKQGQFLALSPKENFRKIEYWKKETKIVHKLLSDLRLPLGFSSDSKFYLTDKNGIEQFRSTAYFANPNAARAAGRKALFAISQLEETEKKVVRATGQGFVLELENMTESLAFSSQTNQNLLAEEQLEIFQTDLLSHAYTLGINPLPNRWKHRFYWINQAGKVDVLYESKDDFKSKKKASTAYETFIAATKDSKFEPSGEPGKYSFDMIAGDQVLTHPKSYATEEARKQALTEVEAMFAFFNNEELNDDCIVLTERSKDEAAYVYRVFKKGNPIAFHPCSCIDLSTEAGQAEYKDRMDALCERQYHYLQIHLEGSKVLCRIEDRWHYVLRDKKTNEVYFTSKEGFYAKSQALEAFASQYLKIIHLASASENYLMQEVEDCPTIYCLGQSVDSALVTFSAMVFDQKEAIANWFCTYPVRIKAKHLGDPCVEDEIRGFYFHLIGDDKDCKTDWLSTTCYESAEAASKDFEYFFALRANKVNFRPSRNTHFTDWREPVQIDPLTEKKIQETGLSNITESAVLSDKTITACCDYISITEVLAESCVEYLDEKSAWGEDDIVAVHSSAVFTSLDEACAALGNFDGSGFGQVCIYQKTTVNTQYSPYFFSFLAPGNDDCTQADPIWIGQQLFKKEANAEAVAEAVAEAIRTTENIRQFFKVVYDEDCQYRIAIVASNEAAIKEALPCKTTPDDCVSTFGQPKGLNRFLAAACHDDAFLPCLEKGKDLAYGFKIIEPDIYYLAQHPYRFHTREDRDQMMQWLFEQLQGKEIILETEKGKDGTYKLRFCVPIVQDVAEIEPVYYVKSSVGFNPFNLNWQISDNGEGARFCLLETIEVFASKDIDSKIISCYTENIKYLLQNAVHLAPTGDFTEEGYGIALINPNGILALHPQSYVCEAEMLEAIAITKAHIHTEGMHLVEHILLRPEKAPDNYDDSDHFDCSCMFLASPDFDCKLPLPAEDLDPCVEADETNTTYVPGADPYSFWATVLFPYWSKRYKQANFKNFVTNTLLQETPAHIALNQLWLSPKQLCKFEDSYRQWLRHKAGLSICDGDMPCDLITCLSELQNYCQPVSTGTEQGCNCEDPSIPVTDLRTFATNSFLDKNSRYTRALPKGKESVRDTDVIVAKMANKAQKPAAKVKSEQLKTTAKKPSATTKLAKAEAVKSKITAKGSTLDKGTKSKISQASERPFLANIKAIASTKVLASKTYKNTLAYAEKVASTNVTKASLQELSKNVVAHSLRYAIGKKGAAEDKVYISLLADAIALTLDQLVKKNRTKAYHQKEWSNLFATLKSNGLDLVLFRKHWYTSSLKKMAEDVPSIDRYLQFFEV